MTVYLICNMSLVFRFYLKVDQHICDIVYEVYTIVLNKFFENNENTFSIIHQNMSSLNAHLDEFKIMLEQHKLQF